LAASGLLRRRRRSARRAVFSITIFHRPGSVLWPLRWLMVYSIMYLRTKKIHYDDRAASAAALGSSSVSWPPFPGRCSPKSPGVVLELDPREASIFVLLLIYGAYFALRGAIEVENGVAVWRPCTLFSRSSRCRS